jgi:hypothetical protein
MMTYDQLVQCNDLDALRKLVKATRSYAYSGSFEKRHREYRQKWQLATNRIAELTKQDAQGGSR